MRSEKAVPTRKEQPLFRTMANKSIRDSGSHQKAKLFWCGLVYTLFLFLDLGAVLVLASEINDYESNYQYTSGLWDIESEIGFVSPPARTSQAVQFSHPRQTTKEFHPVEIPSFLTPNQHREILQSSHLAEVPWYLSRRNSQSNRLSGWKDSNAISKVLSLNRS